MSRQEVALFTLQKVSKVKRKLAESNYLRELKLACGVQEHEDARTSHPCERRASHCKATCGGGRGKF